MQRARDVDRAISTPDSVANSRLAPLAMADLVTGLAPAPAGDMPPTALDHPLGIPPEPSQSRFGAVAGLERINVLADSLMAAGTDAAWGDPRPRFEVVSWVLNMPGRSDVWIDLYVFEGDRVTPQLVKLDYFAPAGGGGDLYRLDLSFAPVHPDVDSDCVSGVAYRLYCRSDHLLCTDGLLHTHDIRSAHQHQAQR
jgi:hypothetical protein